MKQQEKKRKQIRNESYNFLFGIIKDALDNFFGFDIFKEETKRNLNLTYHDEAKRFIFSESFDYFSFNHVWEVIYPEYDLRKTKKYIMNRFKQEYPGVKNARHKSKDNAKR